MPVLSCYWFKGTDFRGNTEFAHQPHDAGSWAWANWRDIGSKRSTLTWEREDREVAIDLQALVNTSSVTQAVDGVLGNEAERKSPLRAGWIPWRYVPYQCKDPARHAELDLLVRMAFDFCIHTPSYCTNANGNISYYIIPYLDGSGHLGAYVDWWSFSFGGGTPFCSGAIDSKLNEKVPSGMDALQAMLDTQLGPLRGTAFDTLYLLPGPGEKTGIGSVNVDDHVSLALLPRATGTSAEESALSFRRLLREAGIDVEAAKLAKATVLEGAGIAKKGTSRAVAEAGGAETRKSGGGAALQPLVRARAASSVIHATLEERSGAGRAGGSA